MKIRQVIRYYMKINLARFNKTDINFQDTLKYAYIYI